MPALHAPDDRRSLVFGIHVKHRRRRSCRQRADYCRRRVRRLARKRSPNVRRRDSGDRCRGPFDSRAMRRASH
jgi:hypothetical protein